jgi:hypothetical protein
MFQSSGSKIARTSNAGGIAPPPIPTSEAPSAEFWAPDDAERQLAAELEKILAHKPVQRAVLVEPNPDDVNETRSSHLQSAHRTLTEALDMASNNAADDGFDWQTPESEASRSNQTQSGDQTVSLQWVAKARSDQRRGAMRNAFGWVATVVIGGAVLGGAAYLLMGWKPDFAGMLQIGQKLVS